MSWNDLGVVTPSEIAWLPFTTANTGEIFRITFAAPRAIDRLATYGWLACRYIGGGEPLPPSLAFRVFPDSRGRLAVIAFPTELIDRGYTQRIFEIKRSARDVVNWSVQLEELI